MQSSLIGKIQKANLYAREPDRVAFSELQTTFRGDNEDLHYALARYVCQWLDERGKLWAFYQRWRDTVATDPSGEKAFKEVVGMTPGEANPVWTKWTLAL